MIEKLEDRLSTPDDATVRALADISGDIMILGAGGKMGPTLARLLKRATPKKSVYAVSRFSDAGVRTRLVEADIQILSADLLDRSAYEKLPQVENVFYLAGMKFGAAQNQPLTWAMNTYLPALMAEHFYRSRIVALSTGNVYPFVGVRSGGADELSPVGPVGEYAQSCLGRERILQYFAERNGTRIVLIRLNYANEPRYGVIVDLAKKILAGEPIRLETGSVNLIWQGDANRYIARAITLAESPAAILNVTGPETVGLRDLAGRIGSRMGKNPVFAGDESPTALLANAGRCFEAFGYPAVTLNAMIAEIVDWVVAGNPTLAKPTKFDVRDGKF